MNSRLPALLFSPVCISTLLMVACTDPSTDERNLGAGGESRSSAGRSGTSGGTAGSGGTNSAGANSTGGSSAGSAGQTDGMGGAPPNLHPPSVPTGLRVEAEQGCSSATWSWNASEPDPEGSAVRGYQVYVNGVHKFTTLTTSQRVMLDGWRFSAGITYSIAVAAVAEDGSVSAQSAPFLYTPPLCENAPAAPTELSARASGCREVMLTWKAATQAAPNDAVRGYLVYRDGQRLSSSNFSGATVIESTSYSDFGVAADTLHTYQVQTISNQAVASLPVEIQVTTPACTDKKPPSAPLNLKSNYYDTSCTFVGLSWDAAHDDVGVHHYNVYRDGLLYDALESSRPRPSTAADLVPLVSYEFEVTAVDAAGNESARSNAVSAAPDCVGFAAKQSRLKASVVLANFTDAKLEPFGVDEVNAQIFTASDSLASYLSATTYGKYTLSGRVHDWFTLPDTVASYCGPLGNDCTGKIYTELYRRMDSDANRLIAIASGIKLAGEGGGDSLLIADWAFQRGIGSLAHELGHTLGLAHAGDLECTGGEVTAPNLLNLEEGGCKPGRYTDGYDAMGSGNVGQFSTYKKEILGVLSANQVAIAKESGSYTLDVMETPSDGIKELRIPLEVNGFFYFLEYRRPIGTDAVNPVDGVLIRLRASTPLTDADTLRLHVIINPDTPFFDRYRNIRVEATNKNDQQITLKVTR